MHEYLLENSSRSIYTTNLHALLVQVDLSLHLHFLFLVDFETSGLVDKAVYEFCVDLRLYLHGI